MYGSSALPLGSASPVMKASPRPEDAAVEDLFLAAAKAEAAAGGGGDYSAPRTPSAPAQGGYNAPPYRSAIKVRGAFVPLTPFFSAPPGCAPPSRPQPPRLQRDCGVSQGRSSPSPRCCSPRSQPAAHRNHPPPGHARLFLFLPSFLPSQPLQIGVSPASSSVLGDHATVASTATQRQWAVDRDAVDALANSGALGRISVPILSSLSVRRSCSRLLRLPSLLLHSLAPLRVADTSAPHLL